MAVTHALASAGYQRRYAPTLRTKAGEVTALGRLAMHQRRRTVPVFQLTPRLSTRFVTDLALVWAGLPIVVDGVADVTSSGTVNNFQSLAFALSNANILVEPLIDCNAPPAYNSAAALIAQQFGRGVVIRVRIDQLPLATQLVIDWGLPIINADLIVDCGHVADVAPGIMAPAVLLALQSVKGLFSQWRSVTLSASAALKDASGLPVGVNFVPRLDWALWHSLHRHFPQLHFGDYGITHRDLSEPPGYAMANATVSPRYCLDDNWLILKGRSTRGAGGQTMNSQYHAHAQVLVNRPDFNGLTFCWGDGEITAIASRSGTGASGSRETWVGIGLNRHLSLVTDRLP